MLRYGKNEELKMDTIYFSNDMNNIIDSLDEHRDLGIQMQADGSFDSQINNVVAKMRRKIGWICRSFSNRSIDFMRRMYCTLMRPHMDYCSQLWGPKEGPALDKLERVQSNFIFRKQLKKSEPQI